MTYSPSRFTHLIAEATEPIPWGWKKMDCIQGLDGWSLNPGVLFKGDGETGDRRTLLSVSRQVLAGETSDKLCILERS